MKVLLAEDSLTMRRLLASQLQRWNYEITEVEDGAKAWEKFQESHFSLVLTDWMMPEVDGLELIRRIRESGHAEYVYIVLLTSKSDNEDLVEAMDAGADDFLAKPCNPKELRVRLRAGERIIELEHTLIEQNHQLMEAQAALVQSEKLAGVGQLAAGMAHEINNPVAFVSNNLAVLQRDVQSLFKLLDQYETCLPVVEREDEHLADRLKKIESECDLPWLKENLPQLFRSSLDGLMRVREIVGNLRDFAHLDQAAADEMDVGAALESTLEILASDLEAKQLTVRTAFEDTLSIYCQPASLKQVFHAILLNAVQASEPKGILEVAVSRNESSVCVEITDHGCGMDETTQRRLFEPFYTTRPVGSGQGLGLAVSYGVVKQHGGSIEFESTPGKGTTFRVMLPDRQKSF
ncbi:MAG TPA: hybrid sensor histidine kinase/response regulator [Planctomycetes bacterium]|nr:hybrid sensor histidine kinase/response regulator [Fuerstiella sp.]HIK92651.1 hybrid sensor histidine kinase/response regulator [Planctomycetota bacterium]